MAQHPGGEKVAESKTDEEHFVLDINIIKATNLKNVDVTPLDKSDPYCVCTVNELSHQTKAIQNDLNPTWNERCTFLTRTQPKTIEFEVWDSDTVGDDSIGRATLSLTGFFEPNHKGYEGWLDLTEKGKINVCVKTKKINLAAMETNLQKLTKELADERAEKTDLKAKINKQDEIIKDEAKEKAQLKETVAKLEKDVTSLNQLNARVVELQKEVEKLTEERNSVRINTNKEIAKLSDQIANLSKEKEIFAETNKDLSRQIAALQEELAQKMRELDSMQDSQRTLELTTAQLKAQIMSTAENNETLQRTIEMESARVNELSSKNAELINALEESEKQTKDLTLQNEKLSDALEESEKKTKDLTLQNEKLKNLPRNEQDSAKEIISLSQAIAEAHETIKNLRQENEQLLRSLEVLQQRLRVSSTRLEELQQVLNRQGDTTSVRNYQERIDALTTINQNLRQEKEQIVIELGVLRTQAQLRNQANSEDRNDSVNLRIQNRKTIVAGGVIVASTVALVLLWMKKKGSVK